MNYLGESRDFLMTMFSCLILRYPVLQDKETYQKTCHDILVSGNTGCCCTREWDCCETEDQVLVLAAEVILAGAYMCLIKADVHLSNSSFSHSSVFCSSHLGRVVIMAMLWKQCEQNRTPSRSISTLLSQKTEQESVKLSPARLQWETSSHLYLLRHLQTK